MRKFTLSPKSDISVPGARNVLSRPEVSRAIPRDGDPAREVLKMLLMNDPIRSRELPSESACERIESRFSVVP